MNKKIKIDSVTKKFGEVIAVNKISLEIGEGEFVTLLGPSGCGKTTLLRIIAGFEKPTEGSVFIKGIEITYLPPEKRPVNMVFQNYALFPHMNVFDNVAYSQVVKKRPLIEIKNEVDEVLSLVGLSGFNERKISQLSGGQAQRVALARAIINKPEVLLLDEPLGALDLQVRKQMQIELKNIQKRLGTTFIYVTHDQEEAMVMSDKIVLINEGKVIQIGKPEEIYENPQTIFASKFIGSTNIIEGTVIRKREDEIIVSTRAGEISCAHNINVKLGDHVYLSVRDEKLLITTEGEETGFENKLKGKVFERIYVGSLVRYSVAVGDDLIITADVPSALHLRAINVGDEVFLYWKKDCSHVLKVE